MLTITASFPAGVIGATEDNLEESANGEHYEHDVLYPEFAKVAVEEGFSEIASVLKAIAVAEKQHEKRFRTLLDNLNEGKVFRRDDVVIWRCRNCGYLHMGKVALEKCPACAHPKAFFELLGENW